MEIFASLDDAEVTAVCDPFEASRNAAAEQFGAAPFADSEQMMDSGHVDAVLVAAPAHLNAAAALPVISRGVTTLLEKPPGLSVADVQQLKDAAERSGARVMVGFDRRFNPFVKRAQAAIAERGELHQLVAEFHKDIRDWTEDARFSEEMFDRLMLESPVHSIDLITYLAASPVKNVSSVVGQVNSPYRDVHTALIEFESGCVAQFTASLTAGGRLERYELHGNAVSAYLEGVNGGSVVADGESSEISDAEGLSSTFLQDRHLVRCAISGEHFGAQAATLESSLATLDLAERIYASAK